LLFNDHSPALTTFPRGGGHATRHRVACHQLIVFGILAAVGLCLAVPTGTVAQTAPPNPIALAIVNGDTITSLDLDETLIATHRTMGNAQREGFDYRNLLKKLVNDRLLIQDAVALAMHEEQRLATALAARRDRHAATLWVKDHFKPDVQIDEDVVRGFFRDKFSRLQFRMVTVRSEDLARQIAADLRNGADMDSTARAQSVDSYRTQGGLLKLKYRIDWELSLRELADTLPAGRISDPFPYRGVYAVVRVEQKVAADPDEFDSLKVGIESRLERLEYETQWGLFMDGLKERFALVVDSASLAALRADSADLFTPDFSVGTDQPIITLGQETRVTDEDLRKSIGHQAMTSGIKAFSLLLRNVVDEIGQKLVLTAAAYADGYDADPVVIREYNRTMDSALVATYLEEIVAPRITFRRSEFEAYYREHLQDFARPDQVQLDRVLADSEAVAVELYERLRDGADLRWVSEHYDAEIAGAKESAEWLPVTTIPDPIREEVDQLRIGEYITPQQTDQGWLILRLKARQPGGTMSLEEAEPDIRRVMFQQQFDAELDSVLSILKENSEIEYREEAIAEYFEDGL